MIAKDGYKRLHEAGIDELQRSVARLAPWLADRVGAIDDWTKAHMLTVRADRLPLWHKPGLLCIGDAAHAMSADLAEVQRRREPAVRLIQRIQRGIQQRVVGETLRHTKQFVPPWLLRLILKTPGLRNIPARMVAFGPKPFRLERADEHPPA